MGDTPLHVACRNVNVEVVNVLLNDERVDVNKANAVSIAYIHICRHEVDEDVIEDATI